MKTLLILLALTMSAAYAGPRVTGNGGGGIKQNGVYKTFYSAGLYIIPEEVTEIPGAELYRKTVSALAGEAGSTMTLLSSALPIGERKFYNIAERSLDDVIMNRLIAEYARVVNQPANDLTIFAITEINSKTTYLLPTFYNLSENEQAAILFHEAYWIMNPNADYARVIQAEMTFQAFLEAQDAGKYNPKLPKLIGTLLNDATFALRSAYKADQKYQTIPAIIDAKGFIKAKNLFLQNESFCESYQRAAGGNAFGNQQYKTAVQCIYSSNNLSEILNFQKTVPKSYFFQELVSFMSHDQKLTFNFSPSKSTTVGQALDVKLKIEDGQYYPGFTQKELNFLIKDIK